MHSPNKIMNSSPAFCSLTSWKLHCLLHQTRLQITAELQTHKDSDMQQNKWTDEQVLLVCLADDAIKQRKWGLRSYESANFEGFLLKRVDIDHWSQCVLIDLLFQFTHLVFWTDCCGFTRQVPKHHPASNLLLLPVGQEKKLGKKKVKLVGWDKDSLKGQ